MNYQKFYSRKNPRAIPIGINNNKNSNQHILINKCGINNHRKSIEKNIVFFFLAGLSGD
jgi:hypothetical protein